MALTAKEKFTASVAVPFWPSWFASGRWDRDTFFGAVGKKGLAARGAFIRAGVTPVVPWQHGRSVSHYPVLLRIPIMER